MQRLDAVVDLFGVAFVSDGVQEVLPPQVCRIHICLNSALRQKVSST